MISKFPADIENPNYRGSVKNFTALKAKFANRLGLQNEIGTMCKLQKANTWLVKTDSNQ